MAIAAQGGLAALAASAAPHKLALWGCSPAELPQELAALVALPALLVNNPTLSGGWLHRAEERSTTAAA